MKSISTPQYIALVIFSLAGLYYIVTKIYHFWTDWRDKNSDIDIDRNNKIIKFERLK